MTLQSSNNQQNHEQDDEMRSDYDFSEGIRGKHYRAYRQGHTVTIHETDGTVSAQQFTLADGAVMLDPDLSLPTHQ